MDKALTHVDDIIATLQGPFVVLRHDLCIKTANRSFCKSFHVTQEETDNHALYDLGDGAWGSPGLRALLDKVLSLNHSVEDVEVEHTFSTIGRKTMLLNASSSRWPKLVNLTPRRTERIVSELLKRVSDDPSGTILANLAKQDFSEVPGLDTPKAVFADALENYVSAGAQKPEISIYSWA